MAGRLAVGKGRHAYIIKMASGVQDITCVFVEVAGSYEKNPLILQCPGMVCSPPVVSKCLGEAHRRLDIIYIIYITLHYINSFFPHTVGNLLFRCNYFLC